MTDHELLLDLQRRVEALESRVNASEGLGATSTSGINFALNPNAFVNKYAQGRTGKEKFTWLVAFLSKGDDTVEVPLKDIQQLWNRMTAKTQLGVKFNYLYTNEAKVNGWVDSPQKGYYRLAAGWYEIYEIKGKE